MNSDWPTDVYWLFDAEDRLLYIGMTGGLKVRLHSHRLYKEWWPRVARVETETFPNRELARERERDAIFEEAPLFNAPGRPRVPALPPILRRDRLASVTELGGAS